MEPGFNRKLLSQLSGVSTFQWRKNVFKANSSSTSENFYLFFSGTAAGLPTFHPTDDAFLYYDRTERFLNLQKILLTGFEEKKKMFHSDFGYLCFFWSKSVGDFECSVCLYFQ